VLELPSSRGTRCSPSVERRRLQGAFVLYLNLATIFASAYHLIWEGNRRSHDKEWPAAVPGGV
jgi:hypothetical protein